MRHPSKGIEKRVAVVGCKHTTRVLIEGLARHGYRIDHCVTISPEKAAHQQVAGYEDLRGFLRSRDIPFTIAEKYSLKSPQDQERLLALELDLLLVMGWQRLLPQWWLERLEIGAFGMHGSFKPLPHGRGRSPMNWSLLQGRTIFFTHLFQYLPGTDDGPVVGVQKFDLTPFDTCLTAHFKNTVAMVKLCVTHLPALLDGTATLTLQPDTGASVFPKRTAEDGLINWDDTTTDIHNLVRAVTRPFPGAFSYLDDREDQRVVIWRSIPFDTHLEWPGARPGEVAEVFDNGMFVVKTGDTTLLVEECEGHHFTPAEVGRRFGNLGKRRRTWGDVPLPLEE